MAALSKRVQTIVHHHGHGHHGKEHHSNHYNIAAEQHQQQHQQASKETYREVTGGDGSSKAMPPIPVE